MVKEELEVVAFQIILHSGEARTIVHEAFDLMREGNFQASEKKLDEANTELLEAHKSQTELLQNYANGDQVVMEVILVHAEDHLMTTMTLREMALEMLHVYKELDSFKKLGASVNG